MNTQVIQILLYYKKLNILQIPNDRRLISCLFTKREKLIRRLKRKVVRLPNTLSWTHYIAIKVTVIVTVTIADAVKFLLPQNIRNQSLVKSFHSFVSRILKWNTKEDFWLRRQWYNYRDTPYTTRSQVQNTCRVWKRVPRPILTSSTNNCLLCKGVGCINTFW